MNVCILLRSHILFCSCGLDLDPVTLIYKLDLGILKMYMHTGNEVSMSGLSKVGAQTGQTHTQTDASEHVTTATLWVVKMYLWYNFLSPWNIK